VPPLEALHAERRSCATMCVRPRNRDAALVFLGLPAACSYLSSRGVSSVTLWPALLGSGLERRCGQMLSRETCLLAQPTSPSLRRHVHMLIG